MTDKEKPRLLGSMIPDNDRCVRVNVREEAKSLLPLLVTSKYSLPQLVLAYQVMEVFMDISGAANAEEMSSNLEWWLTPIPHRGCKQPRVHAVLHRVLSALEGI